MRKPFRVLAAFRDLAAFSAILWTAAVACPVNAFAQQYPFLAVPGGPKSVRSLFQDSRGRLWLGSDQPALFDGTRFFFLRDYGFPATVATSFSDDPSGAMWIGAETGVFRFAGGHVEQIANGVATSVIAVTPDEAVASLAPAGPGNLNNASLVRIRREGKTWKSEALAELHSPGPLTLDSSGMLLYPEPSKGWNEVRLADVLRWRPGTQIAIVRHPIPQFPGNGNLKVLRDRFGCFWLGFANGDAYNCGGGPQAVSIPGQGLRAYLHESPDGNMVLWGDSALVVGRPGSFKVAGRANGLPGLLDAIEGRDGTIWLGTSQGLYRLAYPFRIEYWTIRDGLLDPPWSFARSGGRIYAGLGAGRLVVLSADRMRWDSVATFPGGNVSSLLSLDDGSLLVTLSARGAMQVRTDGKVLAKTLSRNAGMRSARTPDGQIWLGDGGVERLTRQGNILAADPVPLRQNPRGNALALKYEEHTHKFWSCYTGGLIVKDEGGEWKEFTTADGLLGNGCWSLAPLPNGDVWYAYRGVSAIALVRPAAGGGISVRQYGAKEGIGGNDTIDADRRGWIWRDAGTFIGVADQTEAEAGKWLSLDQSDGFPANDMNSGSVFVDDDGSLWWGADNDLAHFTPPSDLVNPQYSPEVFVSAFSWDGQAPQLADAVGGGLPYGSKAVAHLGSLQFDRRNALRVRYRVLPEQSSWTESASLDVPLGSPGWGGHTLEVQARIFTGPWSGTVSRGLTILRPIWLTWPALTGFVLAGAAAAGLGLQWRKRYLRREGARLPDLASLRLEALAPEVHEVLGSVLDGRYEVGHVMARGGFGTVLDGRDRRQGGERCAIKIFRPELRDDEWVAHRFQQEVAALEQIHHPSVVGICGHGTTPGGAPYLVMEYVDGTTLREAAQAGRMALPRIASLLRQAGSALDAIHGHGIFHRDLKPENIMLRSAAPSGQELAIIDFSIAIVKDPDKSVQGISRAAGSIAYMAPESSLGYADASTDIHSLNKILIELLTGQRMAELLPDASIDLPARLRQLLTDRKLGLSEASVDLICAAAEFHPSSRPKVASEYADRIAQDLEAATLTTGPSASPGPSSSDAGSAATSGP